MTSIRHAFRRRAAGWRALGLVALALAAPVLVAAAAVPGPSLAADGTGLPPPSAATLQAFVATLRPEAEAQGISPATFAAAFASLEPDPGVAAMTRRQPENLKSAGDYLAAQVTPSRISAGRRLAARWRNELAAVTRRFGVPATVVVAIWGLETNYGAAPGNKDVIRSMATLGAMGYRPELYRGELLAALALLDRGAASRPQMRGSWAGAMGQPQFMPSSFARYAVDGDGDGRRDIWGSVPDTLASIANFLLQQGWRRGEGWGYEVRLPPGLDLRESRAGFAAWAARGVTRPGGAPLPQAGDGILYFPAGAGGPAFLVTPNFEVIKTYNFSDAYVLSVGTLADGIDGLPPVSARWPAEIPMGREDRIALQARLAERGYPVDNHEGRISLALRDAIRAAEADVGLTPDGNPTEALLKALNDRPAR